MRFSEPRCASSCRLVFRTPLVAIGAFRAFPGDNLFGGDNHASKPIVVFPRLPVVIVPAGEERVVAQSNHAMLYNTGDEYTRRSIEGRGDVSDFFWLREDAISELSAGAHPAARDEPTRPFDRRRGPVAPSLYYAQRRLFEAARRPDADALTIEEETLAIVRDLFAPNPRRSRDAIGPCRAQTRRAHRDAAHDAAETLSRRWMDRWSVDALSEEVNLSPHHLCRVFKREHGVTIHAFLTQLRLRAALERVAETDRGLTQIGLECGFSSHAHFTAAFARAFGQPPSRARDALRDGRLAATAALN